MDHNTTTRLTPNETPHAPAVESDAGIDWADDTGAQTAEYGIVTLAAVGFAGLLAVILSGGDVQGMLTDLIKGALTLG